MVMKQRTRQTWLDLIPGNEPNPEEVFTRDQIATMASGVYHVSASDIRLWEYLGIIPKSIRQWHDGATRTVYPRWYAGIARHVRVLQRRGYTLDDIHAWFAKNVRTYHDVPVFDAEQVCPCCNGAGYVSREDAP